MAGLSSIGLEILRFSVPELAVPRACRGVEGQNDKLNDTLFISAVVVLGARKLYNDCLLVTVYWSVITAGAGTITITAPNNG